MRSTAKSYNITESSLTLKFPSKESAAEFAAWLCGSGEQGYWEWCENNPPYCRTIKYGTTENTIDFTDEEQ